MCHLKRLVSLSITLQQNFAFRNNKHDLRSVNRTIFITLIILILSLIKPSFSTDSISYEQRLQNAIEQAEKELEQERTRIQNELEAHENELNQVLSDCERFSDEIVESKIAIARKQNEIQQIRIQRETLWTEQTNFQKDITQIESICSDVKLELSELLDMMPISDNRLQQRQLLTNLNEISAIDSFEIVIPSLFELIESLLVESQTTSVYSADIMDPQGHSQNVRMLRIGQSMFAYHIPNSSRVAIAISDPYQQGGFRWYENLNKNMQNAIVTAINNIENQDDIYMLPLDVTGTITATTNLSAKSLKGRIKSGGIVMFPLAIVALWLLILIIERSFILIRESRHSLQFCENILELCNDGNFNKAQLLAEKRKGIVSRILRVCLANRNQAPAVLDDAIQEAFLHELPGLERFLPSIRMLSLVAPMLGLLGTVTGIIITFDMISIVGGGKPQLLAGGISEALITTATGLCIAIPGLLAYCFLAGKIEQLIADAERFAASLSNVLKHKQSTSESKAEKTDGNN